MTGPEETEERPPLETAHRLPIVRPEVGEALEDFLARASVAYRWPEGTRREDLRLLAALLNALEDGPAALQSGAYILRALGFSSAPSMALRHMVRYLRERAASDAHPLEDLRANPEHLHFLCSFFSFTQFLSEIVIAHPDYMDWAFRHGRLHRTKTLEDYRSEVHGWLEGRTERDGRRAALTLYKKRELLRIGIRDIREMAGTSALTGELSCLAQAVTEVAHADCRAALVARHGRPIAESTGEESGFCIYAMGKLGGGELNFSSDLDLIYVYTEEGETEGVPEGLGGAAVRRITNHAFFTALAQQIGEYLSGRNPEGFLFRVDARLRPEGQSGPLARSRAGYVVYFNEQAAIWEKVAYQKARLLVGDEALAAMFDQIVQQFVYTGNRPERLFPEVARLKRRIDTERLDEDGRRLDIKRGPGGIREIEFIIACQQLLHGEQLPSLRVRPTLRAIRLLVDHGLLSPDDARTLETAYHLYRRVEHTLQMMNEQQTHRMPREEAERRALALRCGFLDAAEFEARLGDLRTNVRRQFERFFQAEEERPRDLFETLLYEEHPPEDVAAQLSPFGLGTPEGYETLRQLVAGSSEFTPSARGLEEFRDLLPRLLDELKATAVPVLAVRQFERFLRAAKGYAWIYELCRTHPAILRLFVRVLGHGSLLARELTARPEWLDELFNGDGLTEGRTTKAIARFPRHDADEPAEEALRRLRTFKRLEATVIAIQEVVAIAPSADAARRLTALAEFVLAEVARVSEHEVTARVGAQGMPTRWAVLGLGGLGDRRVHLTGDLDIAFVVEREDHWEGHSLARWGDLVARRLIGHMSGITPEGALWKVDARLRPEGRNGPLAASFARFRDYYRGEAGLWEWQALTKARPVAGDLGFGWEVLNALYAIYTEQGPPADLTGQIRDMRHRIDGNTRVPKGSLFDLKASPGGVIDAEFLTQYFQLGASPEAANLFPLTTEEAFDVFTQRGVLSQEEARFVRQHLERLRLLQRHTRLLWETARDLYPEDREKQTSLQRAAADQTILAGLPRRFTLAEDMRRMRAIFESTLAGTA